MNIDDLDFIPKKTFKEIDDKAKWSYVKSLVKIIKNLNIQAEKNCEECEKQLITSKDVNIDLFFEDFRECRNRCGECGKEEQVYMCDLIWNILSHIANELNDIRKRQNGFIRAMLKKDKSGSKLLRKLDKEVKQEGEKEKKSENMFM